MSAGQASALYPLLYPLHLIDVANRFVPRAPRVLQGERAIQAVQFTTRSIVRAWRSCMVVQT
jgi:hypothetical protein